MRKSAKRQDLRVPYVIFLTTLHGNGSSLLSDQLALEWMLHGEERLRASLVSDAHDFGEPRNVVTLERAAFLRHRQLLPAREWVSAVLVGPFGVRPFADFDSNDRRNAVLNGLLNQSASHPFSTNWLEGVRYGQFMHWPLRDNAEVAWSIPFPTEEQPMAERSGKLVSGPNSTPAG
jgi:hypothetical protein